MKDYDKNKESWYLKYWDINNLYGWVMSPVYLCLSILDLSKTVIYEFWYNYVTPKYSENEKLCHMNPDGFIVYVKLGGIYKDITKNVETRFNSSNFEIDRPFTKGKSKSIIGIIKNGLDEQIMNKFVVLRAKIYSYLKGNKDENKKAKDTKKCTVKRKPKFQDYKKLLRRRSNWK